MSDGAQTTTRRAARVERLRGELDSLGARTFLVSNPVNVAYVTGFESSNAAVLVGRDRTVVLTDGRYVAAAREVEGVEVVQSAREIPSFLGKQLADLAEPPVAFEAGHVTFAAWQAIGASGLELRPASGVLERFRAVKDDEELDAIRRSARVTEAAYGRLAREGGVVGRSEAELAWRLATILHEEGADEQAFPAIVAGGPSASVPHHHPGTRPIGSGETLIVDMGAKLAGLCSDCTRTFKTAELPAELERAYELCREAQAAALAAIRPGASARDVDGIARRMIEEAGHEVLHGLGHGVGMEVHEFPRLADTSDATLAAGNVVTVEPGVYLPGLGGVRIEDLVIVADDGAEVLTPFPKHLVTLA
ncbi:MAG: Xaa-Pro peptidase family protein [Actinomycetota bacterium]|nr:Xaa-Pro peptidase family protein [Actinomycetota bacterium]